MRKIAVIAAFIGLVTTAVALGGLYIAPSRQEIALMQMKDFRFMDAFRIFTGLHSEGSQSTNVLGPLIKLNLYYGNIDKAIGIVKSFTAEHPRSADGHKRLADLYMSSQRLEHYCAALEALQKLSPSAANLRALADAYDFLGRSREEFHALARLVDSPDYRPQEEDYYKLGSFYRIDHQAAEATRVLLAFIDEEDYKVHSDIIHLAIQLLLEQGKNQKAFSLARAYFKNGDKESDAIMISSQFQENGQYDLAYELLSPYIPNMDQSLELEQQAVSVQLARKKDEDVYTMLSAQFAHGSLPVSLASTFLQLAVKFKNDALAEAATRALPLDRLAEDEFLPYATFLLHQKKADLAKLLLDKLGTDYLHEAPLLNGVLRVAAYNTPQSIDDLLALPPDVLASTENRILIADICIDYGYTKQAIGLLGAIPVVTILQTVDAAKFAQLYLDVNAADKGAGALAAARPQAAPEIQRAIDRTLFLLAAGQGQTATALQGLKDYANDMELLSDAYYLASRYQRGELALAFARDIYSKAPTEENKFELANALLLDHRYSEALGYLETPARKDATVRAMYFEALADWADEAAHGNFSNSQKTQLTAAIETALKTMPMDGDQKRDFAYVLEETGFIEQAENIFMEFAGDQPYANHDVDELLGFWGEHPSPNALGWMENRARRSAGGEKALWLAQLNDTDHPASVLKIMEGVNTMPPKVADQYIEALVATHDVKRLDHFLAHEIDDESDPARLKALVTIADGEITGPTVEAGWRKLHELDPTDPEAAEKLGLLAFDANRYDEAKTFLDQYLQEGKGDYEVNYAYGEILLSEEKKSQAATYFEHALSQLSELTDKDPDILQDKAQLLYLTGSIPESELLYRQLLAQRPEDKGLRADFGEMLIGTQQFGKAASVLSY